MKEPARREQGMSRRVALVGLSAAVAIGAILLHRYRRGRVSRGSRFDAIIRDPVAAFLRSYDLRTLSATELMEVVQSGLQTPASLARALAFVPRPGDVVTLTTPKTGQTLLLARLRKLSLGHGATDEQLAVDPMHGGAEDSVKWLEHAKAGAHLDDDQPGAFRVFKSHLSAQAMAV